MNEDQVARWQAKTPEQRFLNMLGNEFNQPSRIAEAILADATTCLMGTKENLKPGQMRVILVARGAGHGKAVRDMVTKEVIWTVDAGEEDYEIGQKHGRRMMRQQRILRLLDEALAQGAVATQEDLARVLQVTVRTIKRDCKVLRENGTYLPTRGNLQGIGRGQTHKAQIVKYWLEGQTYDQVARQTHHSVTSVQRYIQAFVRVIQLCERGLTSEEIALLLQVGQPLVEEYLAIYEVHDSLFARQRLAEQLQRLKKRSSKVKKGVQ
jgi:predicted transcriptional regulator